MIQTFSSAQLPATRHSQIRSSTLKAISSHNYCFVIWIYGSIL